MRREGTGGKGKGGRARWPPKEGVEGLWSGRLDVCSTPLRSFPLFEPPGGACACLPARPPSWRSTSLPKATERTSWPRMPMGPCRCRLLPCDGWSEVGSPAHHARTHAPQAPHSSTRQRQSGQARGEGDKPSRDNTHGGATTLAVPIAVPTDRRPFLAPLPFHSCNSTAAPNPLDISAQHIPALSRRPYHLLSPAPPLRPDAFLTLHATPRHATLPHASRLAYAASQSIARGSLRLQGLFLFSPSRIRRAPSCFSDAASALSNVFGASPYT